MKIPNYNYDVSEQGVITNLNTGHVLKTAISKQTGYLYVSLWKGNVGKTCTVHRLVAQAFIPNPKNKPEVNHKNSNRVDPNKDNLEWVTRSENAIHGYEQGFMTQLHQQKIKSFQLDMVVCAVIDGISQSEAAKLFEISEGTLSTRLSRHLKNHLDKAEYKKALHEQKQLRNKAANADKRMPVVQMTKSGDFIREYASINEAANQNPTVHTGSLSNALNPNYPQKSAGGFLWKFA